jgi:CRP-like cAMP-binding protein
VLLKGKIRLHKNDAFITHLEPGAHVGEMALVDRRQPRSASATAEERSRVLIITRKDFYEIIRKEPQLSTKLLWAFVQVLADRLRKTTADLSGARLEAGAEDLTADALFEETTSPMMAIAAISAADVVTPPPVVDKGSPKS